MRPRARTIPLPFASKIPRFTNFSRSTVTTPDADSGSSLFSSSDYDTGPSIIYTIYQSLKPNYTIIDSTGLPVYYISTVGLNPSAPMLTMHAGRNTSAPIVAFTEPNRSVSHTKLVRGNPRNAQHAIWEDLRRVDRWAGVRYRWEMAVVNDSGLVSRRTFLWKRTRTFDVVATVDMIITALPPVPPPEGAKTRKSYKLVDEESGEVLAVLSVHTGLEVRHLGKVRFMSSQYGVAFRMMALLSGFVVKDWDNSDSWDTRSWTL
ncbi:hypothetical protein BDW69DRAFT_203003 [Aspergillus filifer]